MPDDETRAISKEELDELVDQILGETKTGVSVDESIGDADGLPDMKEASGGIRSEIDAERSQKKSYRRTLIGTLLALILIVTVAIIVAGKLMPVVRVSGGNMDPVYRDGDILVLWNSKGYESGQLCCFTWHNKLLIKRIIGMAGDIIDIDYDGNVYVNGDALDEPYLINKSLGNCSVEFPFEVPEGQLFIMGDKRDTSIDSRSLAVGCVGEDAVLGRVLFRIRSIGNSD